MPFFDENPLARLTFQADEAQTVLDLRGLAQHEAMQAVETLLAARAQTDSCLIRFDPAGNDGQETLFLPLGRRLLQARREGRLARCLPAADGAAYFIAFAE